MMPSPARPQHWSTCDPDIRAFLHSVVDTVRQALAADLIGVYLHGSLAFGCYYRAKSDFDLLIVVRDRLTPQARGSLSRLLLSCSERRPTSGDLELTVMTKTAAGTGVHPLPFELHFSESNKEAIRQNALDYSAGGADADLAGHITVARSRGVALFGPPIVDVFGTVPWAAFLDSILADLCWIIEDDHIVESPYYGVLNCCRILQAVTCGPGTVTSKEEGGIWAVTHLEPRHRAIIEQALSCYRGSERVPEEQRRTGGQAWDANALRWFRDDVWARASAARLLQR